MVVRWLLISAVQSYLLSAERVAEQRFLHEVDSFLTRRHGARESEKEEQTKAALVAHGIQETADGARTDVKIGLPKCSDGLLHLEGRYEVKEEVHVEGPSCRVTGSAELLLSAPVRFQGSTVFAGQLSVRAVVDAMSGPCITVQGNFTLQHKARLRLAGCKNQNQKGRGGCLRVDSTAELLGGQLLLQGCEVGSDGEGGGIHVGGALRHWDATIDAAGCHAGEGGAIWVEEIVLSGGNLNITQSYARRDGGAIWAGEMAISGGNLSIEDSKASQENGGAIWVVYLVISGGNLTIRDCMAVNKDGGQRSLSLGNGLRPQKWYATLDDFCSS